jgi:hypothetical protein
VDIMPPSESVEKAPGGLRLGRDWVNLVPASELKGKGAQ